MVASVGIDWSGRGWVAGLYFGDYVAQFGGEGDSGDGDVGTNSSAICIDGDILCVGGGVGGRPL